MKCFFKYWGPNHDSTISFYNLFTENFNIPQYQLDFHKLEYIKTNDLKKLARGKDRKFQFHQNLTKDACYKCGQAIYFTYKVDQHYLTYDTKKLLFLPCCATLIHPHCVRYMLISEPTSKQCIRCKSILCGGINGAILDTARMLRKRIRELNGFSMDWRFPPLSNDILMSQW